MSNFSKPHSNIKSLEYFLFSFKKFNPKVGGFRSKYFWWKFFHNAILKETALGLNSLNKKIWYLPNFTPKLLKIFLSSWASLFIKFFAFSLLITPLFSYNWYDSALIEELVVFMFFKSVKLLSSELIFVFTQFCRHLENSDLSKSLKILLTFRIFLSYYKNFSALNDFAIAS